MSGYGYEWAPYVSVAERKAKAAKHIEKERKKGKNFSPIVIEGRTISKTFWGKAWCENLESYSTYANRLPRGRTYARNGSIIDFQVEKGKILAQVMGSSLYQVNITIAQMEKAKWESLTTVCAGKIDSLIELLQGKFSKAVMEILTEKEHGLFPKPKEIRMRCSCPDSATMCKHVAAVLYGMGASLDQNPEWLFTLRHVDHLDLIASVDVNNALIQSKGPQDLQDEDLSQLFGIDIDSGDAVAQEIVVEPAAVKEAPKKSRGAPKKTAAATVTKKSGTTITIKKKGKVPAAKIKPF